MYVYLSVSLVMMSISLLVDGTGLLASLMFFVKSLIFALPVAILASTLGFYVFKHAFHMSELQYGVRVFFAFLLTIIVCGFVASICVGMLFGIGFWDLSTMMLLFFIPISIVGSVSGFVYWYRTKGEYAV